MLAGQAAGLRAALRNPMLPPRARTAMTNKLNALLTELRSTNNVDFKTVSQFKDTKSYKN